jgi:hypothetical protein
MSAPSSQAQILRGPRPMQLLPLAPARHFLRLVPPLPRLPGAPIARQWPPSGSRAVLAPLAARSGAAEENPCCEEPAQGEAKDGAFPALRSQFLKLMCLLLLLVGLRGCAGSAAFR